MSNRNNLQTDQKPLCATSRCTLKVRKLTFCLKHYRANYYKTHQDLERSRSINYKRTFEGRLVVAYQKLRHRCEGRGKNKGSRYDGLPFLTKKEFLAWAEGSHEYKVLFERWRDSGFLYKLIPTVDRIDPSQGYLLTNIQWLTLSDNSRRGAQLQSAA